MYGFGKTKVSNLIQQEHRLEAGMEDGGVRNENRTEFSPGQIVGLPE